MVNSAKQNDSPTLTHQFKDGNGDVVDLSQNGPYGEPNDIFVTVVAPEGPVVNDESAEIVDEQEGRVKYNLTQSDTGFVGEYEAEWEARWGLIEGRDLVLTSPSSDYQTFTVDKSLGDSNASEISSDLLTGSVDADGNNITNGGRFEADIIEAGILEDRSSGNQVDIDSLASGFASASDNGSEIVGGVSDFNFGTDLTVTDDGDGTVTVDATGTGSGGSLDITDGTTTVTDPTEATLTASDAASVTVSDDGDGTATVDIGATDTDTHIDVDDAGNLLLTDIATLNLGSNLSGSVSGDTVTVSAGLSGDAAWVDKDDDTYLELSDSFNGVDLNGIDIGQAQLFSIGGPVTNSGSGDGPLITNLVGPGLTVNGSSELEVTGSTSGTSSSMTASREAFYVVDGQPLYSTDSTQVYIDPDNGTDDASTAGTQADPYRTIEYATQQNLAFWQRHGFSIILDNANPTNPYDGALMPPTCLGYVDIDYTNFEIIGDPANPGAYPFERSQKLRGAFNYAHDQPNCIIEGVELGGIGIEGQMFFRDCNITGWDANNVGLTAYSGNYSFKSCTFTSQCDAEIYAGSSKTVSCEDCTHNGNTILDNANSSGLQIFLDGDPGIPIFPSAGDYNETPAYINTQSTADIVGNATPYPGA